MKHKSQPSPWAVALVLAVAAALIEGIVVLVFYRDLPFPRLGFSLQYAAFYAVVASALSAAGILTARLVLGRRPAAVAAGLWLGWFVFLTARALMAIELYRSPSLREIPAWPAPLAGGLGALVVAAVGWTLARRARVSTRVAAVPLALLVAIAVPVTLLGPTPALSHGAADEGSPVAARGAALLDPAITSVLLITIDTLRADHTSPYGYERDTTPVLARLAAEGVVVDDCVTPRPGTAPAVASLMTGLLPPLHGVVNNKNVLPDQDLTLAEILRKAGWRTGAISANGNLTRETGFDQGFEGFEALHSDTREDRETSSRRVTAAAVEMLDSLATDHFFLWVHYMDPHTPYIVPRSYQDLFTNDELYGRHQHRQLPIGGHPDAGELSPQAVVDGQRDHDWYIAQYDAEIRYNDESLALLLAGLRERGVLDNTLVIITADHGESLGEHNAYFIHGSDSYQPCAHVPLILLHPSLPRGLRVGRLASLVDVLPTICDLLGLPARPESDGRSLGPLLAGREDAARPDHQLIIGASRHAYLINAVTTGTHKLILDPRREFLYVDAGVERLGRLLAGEEEPCGFRFRVNRRELYDLDADPDEATNLAGSRPELQAGLEERLWARLDRIYRPGAGAEIQEADLSPVQIQRLRALGYVQ